MPRPALPPGVQRLACDVPSGQYGVVGPVDLDEQAELAVPHVLSWLPAAESSRRARRTAIPTAYSSSLRARYVCRSSRIARSGLDAPKFVPQAYATVERSRQLALVLQSVRRCLISLARTGSSAAMPSASTPTTPRSRRTRTRGPGPSRSATRASRTRRSRPPSPTPRRTTASRPPRQRLRRRSTPCRPRGSDCGPRPAHRAHPGAARLHRDSLRPLPVPDRLCGPASCCPPTPSSPSRSPIVSAAEWAVAVTIVVAAVMLLRGRCGTLCGRCWPLSAPCTKSRHGQRRE
jgi:hypothetical protein